MPYKPAHRNGVMRHTSSRRPAYVWSYIYEEDPARMIILIEWSPHPDLDIAVGFAWGQGVGWNVAQGGPGRQFLAWTTGDNVEGGPERVTVDVAGAIAAGLADADGKLRVFICAGWYTTDATGGYAGITATYQGERAERSASNLPNNNGGPATHRVAIAVWDPATSTLTLEAP